MTDIKILQERYKAALVDHQKASSASLQLRQEASRLEAIAHAFQGKIETLEEILKENSVDVEGLKRSPPTGERESTSSTSKGNSGRLPHTGDADI